MQDTNLNWPGFNNFVVSELSPFSMFLISNLDTNYTPMDSAAVSELLY